MVTVKNFREMALSFPDAVEEPHFHLASFRVKKKIFSTLDEKQNRAMIKLPVSEQFVFCSYDNSIFSPVPGSWGSQGSTFVNLANANNKIVKEALQLAYRALLAKNK